MTSDTDSAPWQRLEDLADRGDPGQLKQEMDAIGVRDTARALARLGANHQVQVVTTLEPEVAADILEEISDAQASEILALLEPTQAAPILDAMVSADTADVLSMLPEDQAEEMLSHMDPEEAEDARLLTAYAPDEAGGIMVTEFLAYPEGHTVRQVIDDMRDRSNEYAGYSVQYVYVVGADDRLMGVLPAPRHVAYAQRASGDRYHDQESDCGDGP